MANETINDPNIDEALLEEGVWTRDPETGEIYGVTTHLRPLTDRSSP